MKNLEGQIEIDLHPLNRGDVNVEIQSNRPVLASRVMIGKTPRQVLRLLPMMFNVCGVAQARAAHSAIAQQLGHETLKAEEKARDLMVVAETAREHLMRILIDWPQLFDVEHQGQSLPFISGLVKNISQALFKEGSAFTLNSELNIDEPQLQQLTETLEQYLNEHVFNLSPQQWLDMESFDDLQRWSHGSSIAALSVNAILSRNWAEQGYPEHHPLPELDHQQLLQRFVSSDAESFIKHPEWQGQLYESTSLSRQQTHPLITHLHSEFKSTLITRWVARLVELARIPQLMRELLAQIQVAHDSPAEPPARDGISQVEAARGRLIHHVEIEHNQVMQYQILAPTEWNFHPQGLIQQNLSHITTGDNIELHQIARLMINAIDPCVGYDLRIHQ